MKCEDIQNKLVDFLDGNLNEEEMGLIENSLQECEDCLQELEELKQLFSDLSNEKIEQPSARIRSNFEQLLEYEKSKKVTEVISIQGKTSWKPYLRIAASVLIVASAFIIGTMVGNEKSNSKEAQILAKIESESASQRIAALNLSEDVNATSTKIKQAFINRLLYDEKPSVRLAALDALTKFSTEENVKLAFIKALETDNDPAVQIELIQILVKIQEKRALSPMKELLTKKEVPDYVKTQIQFNISNLS